MIHHYTSIDALAAILESGRLRFSRLDRFDDVREAQNIAGIDFGSQLFASCWIRQDEEDIPQWKIYGDGMRGVRISLPDDPFEWHLLNASGHVTASDVKYYFDNVEAPFSLEEVFGDGYLLSPAVDGPSGFLKQVVYVSDVAEAYGRHVRRNGDALVIDGHPVELARYKWDRWKFQQEHRFVISTSRGPSKTGSQDAYGEGLSEIARDPKWPEMGALVSHIDLKLGAHALDELVVTTGPLSSADEKAHVGRCLPVMRHALESG